MIAIKSYLGSINIHSGSNFILVQEYHGSIVDPQHIDGAIELTIHGQSLISQDQWDLLDQLWIYILNGIEQITNQHNYHSSFPDSPVPLIFQLTSPPEITQMIVGEKSIRYNTTALSIALLQGAEDCLQELSRILHSPNFYQAEIKKIQQVRKLIEIT
jgi:hypothetical protein